MNFFELVPMGQDSGARIDRFICGSLGDMTRSTVQRLCEEGYIRVNGMPAAKNYRVKQGDRVEVNLPPPKAAKPEPQDIPLDIVYEDAHILVVNKARGMVVHPAAGNEDGTLVNALLYHCKGGLSGIGGVARPGIVHRLDKDTSGLLVAAKTDRAHKILSERIKSREVSREYHGVVHGIVAQDTGTVDAPIGRHPADRKKMCVTDKNSRDAVTHFTVLERPDAFTHMRLKLETGRTHQIRVHMAYIGHPVAGDPVYGPKKPALLGGQCLHARALGFEHPETGEYMEFTSILPDYFTAFLKKHGGSIHEGV
ncbi:MAG: RluA family pseudouridine synthase [Oscillospiraceae bacterium]|nr:RluA family pseudouridine synthase [Oscillospiraceae bacterium]